jgi:cyclopropane fatty-acyl-phospholipid synthase-like methyltransferase
MISYKQLYNEHQEYLTLRNREGSNYIKYMNDVKYWKLKYLTFLAERNCIKNEIKNVLEIGCATGELLNLFLSDLNLNKVGLDISDENISYAQSFFPHIKFYSKNHIEYFSSLDQEFDVVILSDILEHVEEDLEMLKLSGKHSKFVLLNMPIEKVPEYKDRTYGFNDIEGHLRAYSIEDTENLIRKAGLRVIDFEVKHYVQEPVFKNYLLNKISNISNNEGEAVINYLRELNEIDININHYKKNYFALLTSIQ